MAKYKAKEDLFVGIHRAHVKGDLVPEENVERNGWEGKVQRVADDEPTDGPFDPSVKTAQEVNTYLATATEDERERVLGAERAGQNRSTVKGV